MIRIFICLMLVPMTCQAVTLVEKQAYVQQLQNQIYELDSQISACNKNKTAWTATTTFGALGTVGTGIGIAVQSVKLQKLKKAGMVPGNPGDSAKDTK